MTESRSIFFFLIYLFLAVLGLRCCARAFSSCGKRGLLFAVVRGLLIVVASLVSKHELQAHRLQQLWLTGSRAQAQQLWCTGLVALWHVGSSRTRARTHAPCIGRQLLNLCVTREACRSILVGERNRGDGSDYKGHEKTSGGEDKFLLLIVMMVSSHMSKLINWYNLKIMHFVECQ